jgi:hypothetical protein
MGALATMCALGAPAHAFAAPSKPVPVNFKSATGDYDYDIDTDGYDKGYW